MNDEERRQAHADEVREWTRKNAERINAKRREQRRLVGPPASEACRQKEHPNHAEYLSKIATQQKKYQERNRDRINTKRRAYNALPVNSERIRCQKNARQHQDKIKKYGLSVEDYAAMFEKQHGACAICKRPETLRHHSNGRIKSLAVDHDHETGDVRGLLCGACNMGIGNLDEDCERMLSAIAYIERYRSRLRLVANAPPV